ncbi:MAG: hypothetical protein LBJ02_00660 [Bifidobacteriaceae bacterium]|nr:hypothetical protein [Bifidobacteriaceae bacterium]
MALFMVTASQLWVSLPGGVVPAVAAATIGGDGPCGPGEGVTVVVDGGGSETTVTRCALGPAGSALEATKNAGFTYEFVPRQMGFVCQIDRHPDPCNGAPADAYWSLWTSQDGQWVYSTTGSATLGAPVDSAIGWSFGAGDPPSRPVPDPVARPGAGPDKSVGQAPDPGADPNRDERSTLGTGNAAAGPDGRVPSSGTPASAAGGPAGGEGFWAWLDTGPAGTVIAAILVAVAALGTWLAARRRRGRDQ